MVCFTVQLSISNHFYRCCLPSSALKLGFLEAGCLSLPSKKPFNLASRLSGLLLLCVAFCGNAISNSGETQPTAEVLIEQGDEITYVVSVPQQCRQQACGLIVDVHGGTMNATKEDQETNLRLLGQHAQEHGALSPYIVVQPELLRNDYRWQQHDMQAILAFVETLPKRFEIRSGDSHFGGFSQGGEMAAWLLCSGNDSFISYSAIAGGAEGLVECIDQGVDPSSPLFYIHGRDDQVMSFAHAKALSQLVNDASHLSWDVRFYFHDMRGGIAGAHCVPGGQGRFGCGEQPIGMQILKFYIAQSKAAQTVAQR